MFHRVKSVSVLPDMCLRVVFADGTVKAYDVKPLLSVWKPFEALGCVHGLFKQVRVDLGGYGISWNDSIDLSCEELWENGVLLNPDMPDLTPAETAFPQTSTEKDS